MSDVQEATNIFLNEMTKTVHSRFENWIHYRHRNIEHNLNWNEEWIEKLTNPIKIVECLTNQVDQVGDRISRLKYKVEEIGSSKQRNEHLKEYTIGTYRNCRTQ